MTADAVTSSWDIDDPDAQAANYDRWADSFERDLFAMGYRLPSVLAAVIARHVDPSDGPILDAGCGTGLQAEPLALAGYGPLVGIDLSEGMLRIARRKGIYAELHRMPVAERLDVPDGSFAVAMAGGVLTPGHAPPEAIDGLLRAVRPKGHVAITVRDDANMDPRYRERAEHWCGESRMRLVYETDAFAGMPYGENADVTHRVRLFEVLG